MRAPVRPLLVLAALLAALLGAGCRAEAPRPPPPGAPIRLVFKHMRMLGGSGAIDRMLAPWRAQHPNVEVVQEELSSESDQQHQFYVTNLEAGSTDFDVLAIDVIWVPEFARAGWLLDLAPAMPPDQVRAAFFPGPAEVVVQGDKTWALPWFVDAGLLYWRTDLLAKHGLAPPRTWTELAEQARQIREKEGDPELRGYLWQGRQSEGLVCAALEVLRGFGGGVLDPKGRVLLQEPASLQGLAFLRALVTSGASPAQTTSMDEEAARQLFQAGHAVFMRNWPYAASLMEREGSPVRGKVGFGPLPVQPGGIAGGTLGGWHLAVNGRIPEWKRDAARSLVTYLTGVEAGRALAQAYGLQPARPEAFAPDSPLKPLLAGARPRPVTPYYLMISQVLQSELSAVVAGIRTPEEAAERAAKAIQLLEGATP